MAEIFIGSFVFCSILLLQNCSRNEESNEPSPQEEQANQVDVIFSDSVTAFNINVVYETGAVPRTGNISLTSTDIWEITETSYESIFQDHVDRNVNVPKTLGEMTEIPDQNKSSWSSEELIALGQQEASLLASENEVNITVIFLRGLYDNRGSVLGVHFSGYPFAFVFKDVVEGVGGSEKTQQYVEQSTVIHEIGHAIGLVNIGLPMVVDHEDGEHPGHTSNEDGVMYWAVESSDDILSVLTDIILGDQLDLFEVESKADARSYHPN